MTPAIRTLKENFPDAEIIYAHSAWINSMIRHMPFITGSVLFENVYSKHLFSKLRGTLKFINAIRKMKVDMVLYGHRSNQLSFILWLCGIRYRLGFKGTKFLTHTAQFRPELREYERYQRVLSESGINVIPSLPALKRPDRRKTRIGIGFSESDLVVGIFPGGGHNPGTEMSIKKWNINNYSDLVMKLNKYNPEIKIMIFEGKDESEKIEMPGALAALKRTIDNDCLACCDFFISGDTGSLHIAAAFGVSTLSIFGPTDPGILAPANEEGKPPKHVYIWKKPECSPCYTPQTAIDRTNPKYWIGDSFVCHMGSNSCISSVTPEEVYGKLKMMLETHNQHHYEM